MGKQDKNTKKLLNEWGDIEKLSALKNEEKRIIEKALDKSSRNAELLKEEVSRIEDEIRDNLEKRNRIGKLIHRLSEDEQRLLNLRYVQKFSWVAVTAKMYLSERQTFYTHCRALKNLEKLLEESE